MNPIKQMVIRIRAILYASGDGLVFDDLTAVMGIPPTSARRREEFRAPQVAHDLWTHVVEDSYAMDWDAVLVPFPGVMTLLGQFQTLLDDRAEQIAAYCQEHNIDLAFSVVVHSDDETLPMCELSRDFIMFLARLGAGIGFDIYVCEGGSLRSTGRTIRAIPTGEHEADVVVRDGSGEVTRMHVVGEQCDRYRTPGWRWGE